eukprot:750435-Hanusia_phi.AAC.7
MLFISPLKPVNVYQRAAALNNDLRYKTCPAIRHRISPTVSKHGSLYVNCIMPFTPCFDCGLTEAGNVLWLD